ncbi:AMP-binding protein [Glaciibacter superstes]|uniref:AMP-binding protein n=1 Tax=Glaciibacter superstes TaxID=501023 RepID=UPI0003B6B13A|nr:AMP-binding protein [Glaciibacter superstes]
MNLNNLTVRSYLESAVERNASAPFLFWEDEQQSYEYFNSRVDQAAQFWFNMGVRKGDRVAFMADNSPAFLHAWLGLAKIGAVLVAINTGFKYAEAKYLVEHSEARFALVDPAHAELFRRIEADVPSLHATLSLGEADGLDNFILESDRFSGAAPSVNVSGDDLISLIYTSGTTGKPKGVMQPHRNYVLTGQAYPHWMKMQKGDRIYACLPLFHINSQAYSTMGAIGAEGALVLAPRFSASRFWPDVRKHEVTVFNFIGAMTVILSKSTPSPEDRDHKVRVAYGVPALPHDVRTTIEDRFGLACISGFGMSETTFGLLEPVDAERKPGSMGIPRSHPDPSVAPTEVKIVNENGEEVPRGESGELIIRTPAMMLGYFREPEKSAEALRDGWLYTGDSARQDEDGWFYFNDRKKDIVRRRGENVSSLEVEIVINQHSDVQESAVIGVPSDLTDEELCAFVVVRPNHEVDPADIIDWCATNLAAFKVPRYIEIVAALPKTPTAKIEKHRLRSRDYAAGIRFDGGVRSTKIASAH